MKNKKMSRRDLLKMAALAGLGGVVACAQEATRTAVAQSPTPWPHSNYLPMISRSSPEPTPTLAPTIAPTASPIPTVVPTVPPPNGLSGRVAHVRAGNVTSWLSTEDGYYWEEVNQNVVNGMVETGLKNLTGKSNLTDAWQTLIPNYKAGEKIAIKVNFNNTDVEGDSNGCSDDGPHIDAIIEPVNALLRTLVVNFGVPASNILVFDARRRIPARFYTRCLYSGVTFGEDPNSCEDDLLTAGNDTRITFAPPSGVTMNPIYLTNFISNTNYLINMPIMKRHHGAGVTLGFKNHFGSILEPYDMHDRTFLYDSGSPNPLWRADYNPMVDMYKNSHIRYKTVLTLGDGLFGCLEGEDSRPQSWSTFEEQPPKSLFFSFDPVAIDSVMADFLLAEPLGSPNPSNSINSIRYLALAETAGLGVHEHVSNPHLSNPYANTGITYSLTNL